MLQFDDKLNGGKGKLVAETTPASNLDSEDEEDYGNCVQESGN